MRVEGLHLYTFNQVAATETWRRAWLARLRAESPGAISDASAAERP